MMNLLKYMIKFFIFFILLFLFIVYTYDAQSYFIETSILSIPEGCLDYNGDGIYNSKDDNYYGAINIYDPSINGFDLMDGKGSVPSKKISCDYSPKNIEVKYLTDIDCTGYCRLYGWIKFKLDL